MIDFVEHCMITAKWVYSKGASFIFSSYPLNKRLIGVWNFYAKKQLKSWMDFTIIL